MAKTTQRRSFQVASGTLSGGVTLPSAERGASEHGGMRYARADTRKADKLADIQDTARQTGKPVTAVVKSKDARTAIATQSVLMDARVNAAKASTDVYGPVVEGYRAFGVGKVRPVI
jgi:hypothetical protein